MASAVTEKDLKRREFILSGNLWLVVLSIAFPLFLYQIINGINDILDNFMSAGISTLAVSASAQMVQVKNMVVALGTGVSSGASILIAREIGKKNYTQARAITSLAFTIVFAICVITLVISIPFARPILSSFGVNDPAVLDAGLNYFRLSMITACLNMINTIYIGAEKARGSTKIITLLNVGVLLIKVSLTSIFVYVLKVNDMTWIGLSSMIATGSLTAYIAFRIGLPDLNIGAFKYKRYLFSYSFKQADFSKPTVKRLTSISFPIFLGKFIFSFGKVSVNAMVDGIKAPDSSDTLIYDYYAKNGYTAYVSRTKGALGISNNMGGMITNCLSSIESTESSIISTNLGAGNTFRAIQTFYVSLIIEIIISSVGVAIISIPQVNDAIVNWFARNASTGEIDYAFANMISGIFFYEKMGIITLGINSAVLGLLYGFGYTKLSMIINIARVFVFRIPILFIAKTSFNMDYHAVGVSMGISNIAIGIVAILTALLVILHIHRKEKIKEEARMLLKEEQIKRTEKVIKNYLDGFTHYNDHTWNYEDGVIMKGAYTMYLATKDDYYLNFLIKHYEGCIDESGKIIGYDPEERNIDNTQKATALFFLNEIHHEERFDKALQEVRHQLDIQNRTKSGSFWHKDIYPWQIWLDGLYMGMPIYSLFATKERSQKEKKDIVNQFYNVEKFNWDENKQVYMHCYDETKSMQWADPVTGRSPNVWLRAAGWLAMADCDVYEIFKTRGAPYYALKIKPLLSKVLKSAEASQDKESKLWYDLPLLPNQKGNYLETSGSLMYAYGYIKGSRLGMIKAAELQKGVSILSSVIDRYVEEDGLHNICKVSGLDAKRRDGSVAYYLSEPVVVNDAKGMGPLMMAFGEYLRATK